MSKYAFTELSDMVLKGEKDGWERYDIPKSMDKRQGRCFELSAKFAIANPSWDVVRATLYPRLGPFADQIYFHGFAVKDDKVYDPIWDEVVDKDRYYKYFDITDEHRYTESDACVKMLKTKNYGPWE
jgi:hypothetical protein